MNIIGISCDYHDSAAVLLKDGKPVAMAQEERFSRKKHDADFPEKALEFVLRSCTKDDIDYAVFYEKPFLKFERFIKSSLSFFPSSRAMFAKGMSLYLKEKLWIRARIQETLDLEENQVYFIPHHLSHAASSFLCSPFQDAAILTVDGVGEWTTTAIGHGNGTNVRLLKEIRFPHSLGLLYSVFTAFLGFKVNDGEYKVMGMAPYGKPTYEEQVRKLVDVKDDGSFRLNLNYFVFPYSTRALFHSRFLDLFGPPRDPKSGHRFDQRHADIAASIQKVTEDIIIGLARTAHDITGSRNLALGGGVALNSVANYKVLKETKFQEIFVQPAAGDAGGALGAALFVWNSSLGNPRSFVMEHAFYGSEYSDEEISGFLREHDIPFTHRPDHLLTEVATRIADGQVVGWFQGRSEWGPRALGNRSILADARRPEMQKTVNLKIKFREGFRPFAPSVLDTETETLFDLPKDQYPSRFMLYVCPVKETVRENNLLPAITHVDGSARPQVVSRDQNPKYYALIEEFRKITGIGAILNTSFNLSDEPIVETPWDAYSSFCRSNIDALVLSDFIIEEKKFGAEHRKRGIA